MPGNRELMSAGDGRVNSLVTKEDVGYKMRCLDASMSEIYGSPSRTRTYNLAVNSRPLYH